MANENETIADIIAEMRDEAARADMEQGYSLDDAAEMMREFASRVDAAAKRMERAHKKELETKDAVIQTEVAARESERDAHKREMKETVRLVSRVAEEMTLGTAKGVAPTMKDVDEWAVRLYDTIDITLLAPARNCDRFNSGDSAKLREAVEQSKLIAESTSGLRLADDDKLRDIAKVCEIALAEPARNCDVGTPDEQEDRFRRYCNSRGTFCGDCPLYNNRRGECRFAWAQMPYEEGGAK